MIDVKVGDTVVLVGDGRSREVEVTKAGPVWITVGTGSSERKYRREDGTDGSGYSQRPRIYTVAQWAEKQQREEALRFLREQGIVIGYGTLWWGREIELAKLIRAAT